MIKEYTDLKTGQTLFRVNTVAKSKIVPGLKIPKQKSGIETRAQAERIYRELHSIAIRELVKREAEGDLWDQLVERWSFALHTGNGLDSPVSQSTAEDYVSIIKCFTKQWCGRAASTITRHEIKLALESVLQAGLSSSRKKYLKTALGRIFQWGIDTGQIKGLSDNPVRGIPLGRVEEKKPQTLTLTEARILLQSAQRLAHPWYPIWAMALMTGMRSGELYALEWTDVDFENGLISVSKSFNKRIRAIKCTKASYWRTVPISPDLCILLKELKVQSAGNKNVLPRFRDWQTGCQANVLRQFCVGLGITPVRFHELRACFTTYLLRDGVPAAQVMKICGWKDLKTMQSYVRLAAVEVQGVTDKLKLLPDKEVLGRVVELVRKG